MIRIKSIAAIVLCGAVALPGFGQTPEYTANAASGFVLCNPQNYRPEPVRAALRSRLTELSRPRPVRATSFGVATRIDLLMRAGNDFLSLRDVVALALGA